jgi:hypothetical protein
MGKKNVYRLETLDLQSGKRSVIPSDQSILGAMWVTKDTLIASNEDSTEFLTFDFKTQKWRNWRLAHS